MSTIILPAAAEPAVSVLVVMTADGPRAERCLRAIAGGAGAVGCEVILVVNGATDDVRALVDERVSGARVVDSPVDLGVPSAWRQALALARAPRVALLHEDAEPLPGWLDPLIAALDADPYAGLAGSRLFYPDGRHQNDGWVLWRDAHVSELRHALAQPDDAAPRPVDYVSSAALLGDRALLVRLELPDERWFPAVYADVDLARSVWADGRTVVSVPQSVVRHGKQAMVQSGGPPARGPRLPAFLYDRNRARFVQKWGAELAGRPERPPDVFPDAVSAEHLLAALAITAQCAAAVRSAPAPAPPAAVRPPGPMRVTVDAERVALAVAARLEIERDFTAWLAAELERALADVETLTRAREAERDGALAHFAALQHELDRAVEANAELTRQLGGG